jgi:hypothetical protein
VGESVDHGRKINWYVIMMASFWGLGLIISVGGLGVDDRVLRKEEVERVDFGENLVVSDR